MHPQTVYAKTSKGVLEIKNKTVKLDRNAGGIFLSVDGKSTVAELVVKSKLDVKTVEGILNDLTQSGYVKVFSTPAAAPAKPAGAIVPGAVARPPAPAPVEEEMDLDFTSPEAVAKVNAEAEARKQKEEQAKARAQAAAKAALEAKARQQAEAQARAAAEARAKTEAEAKAKADAMIKASLAARAKVEAEAKAAAADSQAKAAA
jgi:cysteinyl-tRNA synthetase